MMMMNDRYDILWGNNVNDEIINNVMIWLCLIGNNGEVRYYLMIEWHCVMLGIIREITKCKWQYSSNWRC